MAVSYHIPHVRLASSFRKSIIIKDLSSLKLLHGKFAKDLFFTVTAAQISFQLMAVFINVST